MRHLLLASVLPLSLLFTDPAAAQNDAQYLVCSARNKENTAAYVSGVVTIKPADSADAEHAWKQMAVSKYAALEASAGCTGFPTSAAAETKRTAMVDNMKDDGLKTTDIPWNYVAEAKPAAAPSAHPTPEQAAQAEVPLAKGYCEQNLRGLFDCNCFAQAVLHHRLAHPEEVIKESDGPRPPPIHDLHTGIPYRLDCTECLDDKLLMEWAKDQIVRDFSAAVIGKTIDQVHVDKFADCVAKAFPARYRTNPYLDKYLEALNQARISCGNPRG
ncbi:MAG TPA: hypothetical protein VMT89_19305 [Candidatus Acidoferrales bacterium]|nr:hypothetical protein [Candidatus Acidoferrales bacterium]